MRKRTEVYEKTRTPCLCCIFSLFGMAIVAFSVINSKKKYKADQNRIGMQKLEFHKVGKKTGRFFEKAVL